VLACLDHVASLVVNADHDFGGIPSGFDRLDMNPEYKGTMHIQSQFSLTIAALAFALASGLPKNVSADELKEAKVTQVVQDVKVSTIRCSGATGGGQRDCSPGQRCSNRDPVPERADV